MPIQAPRVVVTGIGLVTPFAADREASWRAILEGRCAARRLGAETLGPDVSLVEAGRAEGARAEWIGAPSPLDAAPEDDDAPDMVVRLAVAAAEEAWADAGWPARACPSDRTGAVIGTSKGGLRSVAALLRGDVDDARAARLWGAFPPHAPSTAVARRFGLEGPLSCPVAACATGLASINRGAELIREGMCDAVLAGSADASLTPVVLASYTRLGVLARGFADPSEAGRPFDRRRSGFFIGEGAAVLALERLDVAAARGARVLGEWLAGGSLADARGLIHLEPDGASLARLIGDTLRRAEVGPEEIDHVNMHGTGTRENDVCETRGIRKVFGAHADRLACSSLKGAIGHLLGAAGSGEHSARDARRDRAADAQPGRPRSGVRSRLHAADRQADAHPDRPQAVAGIRRALDGHGASEDSGRFWRMNQTSGIKSPKQCCRLIRSPYNRQSLNLSGSTIPSGLMFSQVGLREGLDLVRRLLAGVGFALLTSSTLLASMGVQHALELLEEAETSQPASGEEISTATISGRSDRRTVKRLVVLRCPSGPPIQATHAGKPGRLFVFEGHCLPNGLRAPMLS